MKQPTFIAPLLKPRFSSLSVILLLSAVIGVMALPHVPTIAWSSILIDSSATTTQLPVLVNELLAHTDPPQKDTVELYNPNDQPVNVSGWYLSDARDKPKKFKIPANTVIPADGYLLLDPDSFPLDARFVFSAEGEEVYLFATDAAGRLNGYYHGFSFGASPNGVSFGRYVTRAGQEEFPLQSALTLGAANAAPQIGPVVISALNLTPNQADAYIELTNHSTAMVPLFDPTVPANTWQLLGRTDYALPPDLVLAPGATLLIVTADPAIFRAAHAVADSVKIIGPAPQLWLETEAKLILQQPDPPNQDGFVPYIVVDAVHYTNRAPWPTTAAQAQVLSRLDHTGYGNDPANWTLASAER